MNTAAWANRLVVRTFYGRVTWVHLDMKTTCPRSSEVRPVQVARANVWLEAVTGEPC